MDDPVLTSDPRQDLAYIRRTLDSAGRVSTVSGAATMLIGLLALAALALARASGVEAHEPLFLAFSVIVAALSAAIAVLGMALKARRTRQPAWSPVLRKAFWGYAAPMATGVLLTAAAARSAVSLLPTIWLACYGAALAVAGLSSVSPVRWLGVCFLALALIAVLVPSSAALLLLALGFGGLHLAFGAYIAWRHNG